MIRDFSEKAKYTLYENIDSINPASSYEGIWDYLSDTKGSTKEWIWKLSIAGLLDGVDAYHRLVSERQEANKAEIDRIFENVGKVDEKYAGYFVEINEALKSKVDFINRMAETIAIKDPVEFSAATSSLSTSLLDTQEDEVEILIKAYKQGLITEFSGKQRAKLDKFAKGQSARLGQDIARDGEEAKRESQWLLVDVYRALNPDIAEKFDALLNSGNEPIKEFDRYNIMYIAYTADEPFRELFLGTLGTYTLGNVTLTDGSFYTSTGNAEKYPFAKENTVNLNPDKTLYYDVKGPYNTFFHECGHAIDYQLGDNNYYSRQYMDGTNYFTISEDVYTYIGKVVIECCNKEFGYLTDKEVENVKVSIINCIKYGNNQSLLTDTEKEIYVKFEENIKNELNGTGEYQAETKDGEQTEALIRAGISDIYGGVTNNVIAGQRSHWGQDEKDVDKDGNIEEYIYWYELEPPYEHTGKQEMEMWAHYFSFGITGNNEAVNDMRIYLTSTMERYGEMAADMLENI